MGFVSVLGVVLVDDVVVHFAREDGLLDEVVVGRLFFGVVAGEGIAVIVVIVIVAVVIVVVGHGHFDADECCV